MPRYTVTRPYSADHNGRRFGPWSEGEAVDLDAVDAEWVNRDSPGVLASGEKKAPPAQAAAKTPARARPAKGKSR